MPLSANATQTTTDGFNFYLMALEHDALSLLYGSYFGGANSQEHVDGGTSRFDKKELFISQYVQVVEVMMTSLLHQVLGQGHCMVITLTKRVTVIMEHLN